LRTKIAEGEERITDNDAIRFFYMANALLQNYKSKWISPSALLYPPAPLFSLCLTFLFPSHKSGPSVRIADYHG
jgi:hypothetical protein